MQASPRWADGGFRNLHPIPARLRSTVVPRPTLSDFLCADEGRTPPGPLPAHDPRATWLQQPSSGLRATWLGHSTVLVEIDGYRVLTDPVWGTRASPFRLLGPKRFQPMPLRLRDMPAVDLVVISHDHYDHLDYPTIRALARHTQVPFVTSLGVGAHLQAWGVAPERITELDWWESHTVPGTGLTLTAAPAQHFSGRGLKDRNATLWSSLVIAGPRHCVFFSGDTGLTSEYQQIRDRLGPFDLVMLEVGAYHPSWGDIHLGPENALQAQAWLGGAPLLPVHWGTFSLAMHAWNEPVETLLHLAGQSGATLLMPEPGQTVEPAQAGPVSAWWRRLQGLAGQPGQAPADTAEPPPALRPGFPWPLD
jgi:L-ascorbate metabolism protein UlaG (beta-lactamase superfamily)